MENRVYKSIKSLYGLKESPRAWNECLDKFLTSIGFERSNLDLCLYTHGIGEDKIYLLIFVDDLIICGKDKGILQKFKILLSKSFKLKDLGNIKEYLGIFVEYENQNCVMKLSQTKYIVFSEKI